jgi:hypothetical protein
MSSQDAWGAKRAEIGFWLEREVWNPLRNMMNIFHVLPLAAVIVLFVLLATDGQFRELYISYLEDAKVITVVVVARIVAAFATLALISAVLYEVHYALSTMRLNLVYSSSSNPQARSKLRDLQRAAAFGLAFLPWLGFTIGLLGARNFVADRYCHLANVASVHGEALRNMQHLPLANSWTIALALIFLGAVAAYFASTADQNRIAPRSVALLTPLLAVFLFALFTDQFDMAWTIWTAMTVVATGAATVVYFWLYHALYHRRSSFAFLRNRSRLGVSLRRRRRQRLAVWAFLPWLGVALYFVIVQFFRSPAGFRDDWIIPGDQRIISTCPVSLRWIPVPGDWAIFPVAMCCTLAVGLLVGHLLGRFPNSPRRRWAIIAVICVLAFAVWVLSFGGVAHAIAVYRFLGPLGTVFLELLFFISLFAALAVLSQRSGFPALTLVILTVVVCVMFPSYAGWTAAALGIVYAICAFMAFVSRRFALGLVALLLIAAGAGNSLEMFREKPIRQILTTADKSDTLKIQFLCWLDQRGIPSVRTDDQKSNCSNQPNRPTQQQKPYAVFIFAAEGGGIYAASAASTFLAKLADDAPDFTGHVFAISGVSGGSIGATVFQALDHARNPDPVLATGSSAAGDTVQNDDGTCPQYRGPDNGQTQSSLNAEVKNVMEDDHFSPVVGSIFPEIFGAPLTRASALVASFDYSTAVQDNEAGRELCAPFKQHWTRLSVAPALVLNSTWVETGFRVAFSPFQLHAVDESLYSFSDKDMPDEGCPLGRHDCMSLMSAAAVSARFPLIMPPFSVSLENDQDTIVGSNPASKYDPSATDRSARGVGSAKNGTDFKQPTKRWNFVDGAYSDNSGSTTALDLYRVLSSVADQNKGAVVLRIILITSANPQPKLTDQSINGTVFRDTIAPIDALMKVREDLGDEAVARACTFIYPNSETSQNPANAQALPRKISPRDREVNESCIDHAGDADSALQIVEIQDQTYGLALGWKISRTTFDVVSWMLGTSDACHGASNVPSTQEQDTVSTQQNVNAQLTDEILQRNSCVMRAILDLVEKSPAAAAAPAPHAGERAR